METRDFLRGRRRSELTEAEIAALETAIERVETVPARKVMSRRGERMRYSTLLVEGYACRYMDARDGYRQLLSYHVPGDFVDLHGYPSRFIDHDVGTISEAKFAFIPHEQIDRIMVDRPHLAAMLWFSTLLDAALHREWIFRIGRLDAAGRLAHFLCETFCRMSAVGRVSDNGYDLPLTQQDLGEATGLTSVHVNRIVRRLREDGLAIVGRGKARILDFGQLARVGEFDSDYLYLEDGPWKA
ncbi:Crp/Fnr family transcriptional regulator [Sphingomonas jeddahensis]|uniref:Anaerobic regulatory protein n=1 Tax=Sphingomonas jeddahensis TaxID=1915074 RepID=A0A1V2EZI4_9SPHN|nr:Crp/Fnr family transcriptional regulator [Sphingomonas jeddahensis]ONF97698.1 Anaerobic regulatory protein [Sphingomonas jeddahensis]